MKKLLIITIFATLSCYVFSQEVVIRDTLRGNFFPNNSVTHLTVSGEIDARTFLFIFRNMPNLTYLDLSQAKIVSYKGRFYPIFDRSSNSYDYASNKIPEYALYNCSNLKKVILPESLTAIASSAFRATGIDSVVIP